MRREGPESCLPIASKERARKWDEDKLKEYTRRAKEGRQHNLREEAKDDVRRTMNGLQSGAGDAYLDRNGNELPDYSEDAPEGGSGGAESNAPGSNGS
mgnify:CR=1 FL=1